MQFLPMPCVVPQDLEAALTDFAASAAPVDALKGKELLKVYRRLAARGTFPEVYGYLRGRTLVLVTPRPPYVWAEVWLDWYDYKPLRNGLPPLHYRLQIRRGTQALSEDVRVATLAEAMQVLLDEFETETYGREAA